MNGQTFFTFPPDLEKSGGVGRPPPPDLFFRQIDFFAFFLSCDVNPLGRSVVGQVLI